MPLFLKIFLIVSLMVNYLPALRFRKSKYFIYFFIAALIGSIHVAIIFFFKVNSYSVLPFISPLLLLALPNREIKQIIFSLLSLLILFPHFSENKIIPLMISTLNSAYIIFLLCEDLFNEIKINSFVPLFLPFLIMDILRGTINYYLYYENQQLLIRFASLFAVLEIITVLLIAYFGPSTNVRIKHKKVIVHNDENINPNSPNLQIIQLTKKELFNGLTNMELKVLSLLAEGLTNQEIANKLYVEKKTVYFHLGNIKSKLNIKSTSQLTKYAFKNFEKLQKSQ
jgi:DNA-binding CsgD family transcriptional regulator